MKSLSKALLATFVLMPVMALAQRADTMRVAADTGRPFVRGGVYDKPFQSHLFGRTAIGGYAEAHARYERADGVRAASGFLAKRFNLFTATSVSDHVRFAAELEFEEGGHEIALEFAAIDLRVHPGLTLRGGMVLSPLGRFNLSHDSPLNEFTDRPLVSTEVLGVALSEPGFGALGWFGVGRRGRVTYEAYLTNGFHDGLIVDSPEGTHIPLGRGNFEDDNGSPAVVGRLAWSPAVGAEVGLSAHHGAYNTFAEDGITLDKRRNLTIAVVDGEATVGGVRVMGEAALATIDVVESLRGIYAQRQRGLFIEAVREFGRGWVSTMPTSAFAVKARADYLDRDVDREGTSSSSITVGVNFRPTSETALKLDFVRGRGRDRFNTAADRAAALFSIATYF
jgi:hypothetical protein